MDGDAGEEKQQLQTYLSSIEGPQATNLSYPLALAFTNSSLTLPVVIIG